MKNMNEICRNILMVGGLLTAGIAEIDGLAAGVADRELQKHLSNRGELQEKYGVQTHCASSGGLFETYCLDDVAGINEPDRSRILSSYYKELIEKNSVVPPDMAARRRIKRDMVGLFGGLLVASAAKRQRTIKE